MGKRQVITVCRLRLSSGYSTGSDHTWTFQYFKLRTYNECIVTNLWFVNESNRRIGAVARQDRLVRTIDELDAQHFSVAITNSKMRTVGGWRVGREANGRPSAAFLGGQEVDEDFRKTSHASFQPLQLPLPPHDILVVPLDVASLGQPAFQFLLFDLVGGRVAYLGGLEAALGVELLFLE
jgi:hypothetical protein